MARNTVAGGSGRRILEPNRVTDRRFGAFYAPEPARSRDGARVGKVTEASPESDLATSQQTSFAFLPIGSGPAPSLGERSSGVCRTPLRWGIRADRS